jgi:N-acetylglucosamine kinase-like BadF-type ATPase
MTLIMGVDAGQGATRAVVLADDGSVAGRGEADGVPHLCTADGPAAAARAIVAAMQQATHRTRMPGTCVIGISGWTSDHAPRTELLDRIVSGAPSGCTYLTSDAVTAYFATRPGRRQVALAVGTGAVAIAADGRGTWSIADGVGHLLGDEGSGFWIGQRGLASAIAAADGRGGSDQLMRSAMTRYGTAAAIPEAVYGSPRPAVAVAAFAPDVVAAAIEGDAIADGILRAAGAALSRSVVAAANAVFGDATITVVVTGGMTAAENPLMSHLPQVLQQARPGTVMRQHNRQPIDGALSLAREPERLARWFPGLVMEAAAL